MVAMHKHLAERPVGATCEVSPFNCSELDHPKAQGVRNRIGAADGFELIEK
jgi:hypothetical protein